MIKTPEYICRIRRQQYGSEAAYPIESTVRHSNWALLKDRIAVVLFLLALMIFAYTFLRAPLFEK